MKIEPVCISCEMEGAIEQIELSTQDKEVQLKALSSFLEFLESNVSEDLVPARIGTERNRIISEITSNPDPYTQIKERSNETAAKLEPIAEELVAEGKGKEKLRRALVVATLGNLMDFSISDYELDYSSFREKFKKLFRSGFAHDDSEKIVSWIGASDKILYLLDNCGEVILDRVLMKEIRRKGPNLLVAARSRPVQDDVTLEIARKLEIDEIGKLLPAGTVTGVDPAGAPSELRRQIENADLVISKGQGNFEMFSEFEDRFRGRLVYLLMAKCDPVAHYLNVERGALVAKAVE